MAWGEIAGAGIGALAEMFGAESANQANKKEAQKNRVFQERMSSTAHQREVEDLRKAGLNPVLSANAGASTPAGSTATLSNAAQGLGSTAREVAMMKSALTKNQAEIGLIDSQRKQSDANASKARMETTVLSKELPRADITNKVYNVLQPYLDKILGSDVKPIELKARDIPGKIDEYQKRNKTENDASKKRQQDNWQNSKIRLF